MGTVFAGRVGPSGFIKEILAEPEGEQLELLGLGKYCTALEVDRLSFSSLYKLGNKVIIHSIHLCHMANHLSLPQKQIKATNLCFSFR